MEDFDTQQKEAPISVGDWVITILVASLPLIGIIMLFIWGFGSGTPKSKANYAKAALIWLGIVMVLSFLIFAMFGTALFLGAGAENGF